MDDRIQINVRVKPGMHRRFKKACIDAGVTMTTLLVSFIEAFVEGQMIYEASDDIPLKSRKEDVRED